MYAVLMPLHPLDDGAFCFLPDIERERLWQTKSVIHWTNWRSDFVGYSMTSTGFLARNRLRNLYVCLYLSQCAGHRRMGHTANTEMTLPPR